MISRILFAFVTMTVFLGEIAHACPEGYEEHCYLHKKTGEYHCRCGRATSHSPLPGKKIDPDIYTDSGNTTCVVYGEKGPLSGGREVSYHARGETEKRATTRAMKRCSYYGARSCEIDSCWDSEG